MSRFLSLGALALGAWAAGGCAAAVESSKIEDRARRTIPIPICLKSLPRHGQAGVVATLAPQDYWSLVLPSYIPDEGTVDPGAADCAGAPLLSAPELSDAKGPRTSVNVNATDLTVAKGPDGFQIVWLRSHRFEDGTSAGPITLMRPREAYAEAYAIGLYRGVPATSKFAFQRLGPEILISAANEECSGAAAGQNCDSSVLFYLMRDGALKAAGKMDLDRVHYGTAPGVSGMVQYRLTGTPKFKEKSIVVTEQLVMRDSGQNEIRRASLDRTWTLATNGTLVADVDSLWGRIVAPSPSPAANPRPAPAPSPATNPRPAPSPAPAPSPPLREHL